MNQARRFIRDPAGFTGAEKALLVCVALAIVVLTGHLVSRGGQKGGDDARRTLVENPLATGQMGAVGPSRYAAAIGQPGDVQGEKPPEAAVKALKDRFEIVAPDFEGERRPNQLTQAEFDKLAKLYDDIKSGKTDIKFGAKDSAADPKFRDNVMNDLGTIMQTAAGRDMIAKMAANPNGNSVTFLMHRDAQGNPDTTNAYADAADPRNRSRWGDGKGVDAVMAYVPGKGVVIPGGSAPWLPLRVDVVLFHEMVHAYHMTHGTMDDSLVRPGKNTANIDVQSGIRNSEYQAVGLGTYSNAALSENRYRKERNGIAGHPGEVGGDKTMKQRDTYVIQTVAPVAAPAPAPEPAPAPAPAPSP
jgi:hypothetical protein